MGKNIGIGVGAAVAIGVVLMLVVFDGQSSAPAPIDTATSSPVQSSNTPPAQPVGQQPQAQPERVSVVGYWECLPKKGDGPHTMECAFGIAIDQSDGHYAINTALMSTYPVDYSTGTKVRVSGTLHPAEPNTSYDIDGIIWATTIEKI